MVEGAESQVEQWMSLRRKEESSEAKKMNHAPVELRRLEVGGYVHATPAECAQNAPCAAALRGWIRTFKSDAKRSP